MSAAMNIVGYDENIFPGVAHRSGIYPTIDPQKHYDVQSYKDKVVLVTGASRGLGQEPPGCAYVVAVGRKLESLNDTKAMILNERPHARVLLLTADVKDTERAEEVVKATIVEFGRLDVLVANAGGSRRFVAGQGFADRDPRGWWNVMEVNLLGVYNYVHFAIPELKKTHGSVIATGSDAAQMRVPGYSDYSLSKFALNRFIELVPIENPEVKAFVIHPGIVDTEMFRNSGGGKYVSATESPALFAATAMYLTSGEADYLNGRYVAATWDLGEVEEKWKQKIVEQHAFVAKLVVPK